MNEDKKSPIINNDVDHISIENNIDKVQKDIILAQGNVTPREPNPFDTLDSGMRSRLFQLFLFFAAVVVIFGYIVGNKKTSMIGVAFFFIIGIASVGYSLIKQVVRNVKSQKPNKNRAILGSIIVLIIVMPILGYTAIGAFWIVTLFMGLWELNS